MNSRSAPIVLTPPEGRTVAVVGDVYRFLVTGADTNGKYAAWEAIVPPGGGPPPHVHSREDEGFYILEGEITLTVDNVPIVAKAGMFANMPIGTPHSFKNESSRPARMLITVAPSGLEEMFLEFGVPLAEGATSAPPATKEEIDKLLAVAPKYGIEVRLPGHGTMHQ
jgi:quercetin dioxygenase-like cupin family protein